MRHPAPAPRVPDAPRRRLAVFMLILWPLFAASGGCSRLPRIVVLEDPLSAAEHVDLGVAYEGNGELDLAKREYERALRKDGGHFRARVNLGNVLVEKKEYAEARVRYIEALAIRPGDPETTNNLAWAALLSGIRNDIDDALARMEAAVQAPGGRVPQLLDTLGVLRMRAGLPGPASEALAEAEAACAREGSGCPDGTLREIREHRRELADRFPAPAPPGTLVR